MASKHCFALYVSSLDKLNQDKDDTFFYEDEKLWHRVTHVLRLKNGAKFELFDGLRFVRVMLVSAKERAKNRLYVRIIDKGSVVRQKPDVTLYVGLTKKDAFYEIIYAAGQFGIARIVPLLTKRIHKNWWTDKEMRRCREYLKAGAEQAKTYWFGSIEAPMPFDEAVNSAPEESPLFVCNAQASVSLIEACKEIKGQSLFLFIGPEGGFESYEELMLQENGVQSVTLSQAILRSQDASLLSFGIIRMQL